MRYPKDRVTTMLSPLRSKRVQWSSLDFCISAKESFAIPDTRDLTTQLAKLNRVSERYPPIEQYLAMSTQRLCAIELSVAGLFNFARV